MVYNPVVLVYVGLCWFITPLKTSSLYRNHATVITNGDIQVHPQLLDVLHLAVPNLDDGGNVTMNLLAMKKCIWVCLKMGYTPNYSHLVGIMIINHWV